MIKSSKSKSTALAANSARTGTVRCLQLLLLLGLSLSSITALAQQVWFAPTDDLGRGPNRDLYLNHDYPHLFNPKPAWSAKTDVFEISPMMGSVVGPAEELKTIDAFLKDRHIALSVGVDATLLDNVDRTPGECGFGIEGSNRPGRNAGAFKRLKQLGIEITYVALDEPLTFGHYYAERPDGARRNACHYSIDDTARRVARAVAEIRQSYPDVRVVDEEAPPSTTAQQWNKDFPAWLKAYRDAAGAPFDAVVFDVNWRQPWQATVAPSLRAAHDAGVRAGIILDGTGPGASDADSVAARKSNIQAVEASGLKFDLVIVANWTPHPARNLPESDPETLTSVLAWYQSRRSSPTR